ncbi:protein kinase family protein [Sansalvadorimonas sp. 2012CJ34-2]|uniref:Protein kinase family protein n=1 Tax=Parendozoicomonas callyspongiae TaxID=2942213 RepID=A0ABT0PH24_9GAMM|nr:protein kinase family protein [Sansalvadorimonas sp. 2012CJ34-2]MCL6270659.1 protein kinase family protein [Sansalvadorimonas sp. 2012CJ34-2]
MAYSIGTSNQDYGVGVLIGAVGRISGAIAHFSHRVAQRSPVGSQILRQPEQGYVDAAGKHLTSRECNITTYNGRIWKVTEPGDQLCPFVAKATFKSGSNRRSQDDFTDAQRLLLREASIHQVLEHENIVPFIGSFKHSDEGFIMLQSLMAGDLSNLLSLQANNRLSLGQLSEVGRQVSQGLQYLHEKVKLMHGDLHDGNVLYETDQSGCLFFKLMDFSESRHIGEKGRMLQRYYLPPEVAACWKEIFPEMARPKSKPVADAAIDSWSFAAMIIRLLFANVIKHDQAGQIGRDQSWIGVLAKNTACSGKLEREVDRVVVSLTDSGDADYPGQKCEVKELLLKITQCLHLSSKERASSTELVGYFTSLSRGSP